MSKKIQISHLNTFSFPLLKANGKEKKAVFNHKISEKTPS